MNFGNPKNSFKMPTRFTFSCDYALAKKIKENSKYFNYCQSDLVKQAITELIERIENKEKKENTNDKV